jgi:hypothetical protein
MEFGSVSLNNKHSTHTTLRFEKTFPEASDFPESAAVCQEPRVALDTQQNFTRKELQQHLSAVYEVIYESRWTSCVRVVEDDFQLYTNKLPFGIRIHRRVGNVPIQQIKRNTYHVF